MQEGDLLAYKGKPLKLFGLDYTELVYVEAGSFMIGDNKSSKNREKPEVEITFKSGFYIGKYLVTQELYKIIMGAEPSRFKGKHRPVEQLSHDDISKGANSFLSKLNAKIKIEYSGLIGDFVLPSEAQWEYAARGGQEWDKPKLEYSGSQNINNVTWFVENSNGQTMPVGLKQPNCLGIYDMSGNVREWCADIYNEDYSKIPKDGSAFTERGSYRILRGGSYFGKADYCRIAYRYYVSPAYRDYDFGFRLVFPQLMP